MAKTLKRLWWLAMIGGAGYAAWSFWRVRRGEPATAVAVAAAPRTAASSPPTPEPAPQPLVWVEPADGACPATHPIKANGNSGIFHVPGGRFYDRTRAERCYASPEAAEADGYRASKG